MRFLKVRPFVKIMKPNFLNHNGDVVRREKLVFVKVLVFPDQLEEILLKISHVSINSNGKWTVLNLKQLNYEKILKIKKKRLKILFKQSGWIVLLTILLEVFFICCCSFS